MKRIAELTRVDLDRAPVWRYEGANDDVATVAATDLRELSESEPTAFIARTEFVLATGEQFVGFCSPMDDSGLDYLQPVILTPNGPVFFWFEEPPTAEFLTEQAARLGHRHQEIFPIHFRCTVAVNGRFVTGSISADDLTGAA